MTRNEAISVLETKIKSLRWDLNPWAYMGDSDGYSDAEYNNRRDHEEADVLEKVLEALR